MGLKYYAAMKDAPVSDLYRQDNISTESQLMDFSYSSWKYFPDTDRSKGSYIMFIKVGKLTMAHMFQDKLINQVQKVSTMHHVLQECL